MAVRLNNSCAPLEKSGRLLRNQGFAPGRTVCVYTSTSLPLPTRDAPRRQQTSRVPASPPRSTRGCASMLASSASRLRSALAASGSRRGVTNGLAALQQWRGLTDQAAETHDDFRPQVKATTVNVDEQIKQDISSHKAFVYMKGVPEAPQCGFSNMACRILDAYGVEYGSRNVLTDPDLREGVKKFTDWPTIPQVFVKGNFLGGSDILMGMHQSGDLEKLLKDSAHDSEAS